MLWNNSAMRLPADLQAIARTKRLLRSADFEAAGISRVQLSRWARTGQLHRVSRGLYALPGHEPSSEFASLITVAHKAPRAVFCLLSALRIHRLTTQAPFEVWIAIGKDDKPPRLGYPPLRVVRFSDSTLDAGIEPHQVQGVTLRATGVARTIADCFKFRNKIGLDVALEALREARRGKRVTADDLWHYAKLDRVTNVMRPYLESIA